MILPSQVHPEKKEGALSSAGSPGFLDIIEYIEETCISSLIPIVTDDSFRLYRRSLFCDLLLLQSLLILKFFCARPCKIRNF